MAPDSPTRRALLAEARESFGRLVYTHKTHEKDAERFRRLDNVVRWAQIILAVATTTSAVSDLLSELAWFPVLSALLAAGTSAAALVSKNLNYADRAAAHTATARRLWELRDAYQALVTDTFTGQLSFEGTRGRRDELRDQLADVYRTAPPTTPKGYAAASKALQVNQELTFSDSEIDQFLPSALRLSTPPDRLPQTERPRPSE